MKQNGINRNEAKTIEPKPKRNETNQNETNPTGTKGHKSQLH
jgi:hypothetical protein